MTIFDLKKMARTSLSGKWWSFIGLTFLYFLFTGLISGLVSLIRLDFTSFISAGFIESGTIPQLIFIALIVPLSLITIPVEYGFYHAHITSARENEPAEPADLFAGFKRFWFVVALILIKNIIIYFGLMLFIIPGIIIALAYAMWPFILRDHPELSIKEVLERSRILMQGHKWELFQLLFSFIGWAILSILTLGIGFFLLIPYVCMSIYHFYETIRYELDPDPSENMEETEETSPYLSNEDTDNENPAEEEDFPKISEKTDFPEDNNQ
ncbi:MAG: DUF975 family protein [Bacteroidales bacterium]|nr:DUF975 family protein [Bacteroidales bacterium]